MRSKQTHSDACTVELCLIDFNILECFNIVLITATPQASFVKMFHHQLCHLYETPTFKTKVLCLVILVVLMYTAYKMPFAA